MKSIIRIELLSFFSFYILASCDRFPRDNPIDPANTTGGQAEIVLAEEPMIDDALEYDEQNNRNGVVEPGETIRFVAELRNAGDETANDVTATLSSTNPCVLSSMVRSVSGNRAYYGDIDSGREGPSSEQAGTFYYEVVFSSTECAAGDTVALLLEVEDETGQTEDIPLEFEINESDLRIEIVDWFRNDTYPNEDCNIDNDYFEIGETVQLDIRIRNIGSSLARSVQARLLWVTSGCVRFPRGEEGKSEWLSYGDIRPESSKAADQSAAFEVQTSIDECSVGDLDLELEVKDASEHFSAQPLRLLVEGISLRQPDVVLSGSVSSVDDDPAYSEANDGDNNADPGETIRLDVNFKNEGSDTVRSVRFELDNERKPSCISKWFVLNENQDPLEEDQLNPNESLTGWTLVVDLSEEDCERDVDLTFTATDDCGRKWPIEIPLSID